MKPDEYFRMMYPYIGQAKQPSEFIDDLLCCFVMDDEDFAEISLIDKTSDYKNRLYNGSKAFPISLAAQLLDISDPLRFSAYINDLLSEDLAENLDNELDELGIDIQGDDVADKCAKLFVSILTETARRTKRKGIPANTASSQKQKLTGVPIATVYVKDGKISINGQLFSLHEKITPPEDIAQEEIPYIKALFAAYAQATGMASVTKDNLYTLSERYRRNYSDQRENYYNAARVERSVREIFENGEQEFGKIKEDAYDGVVDVCWNDFDDGFKRLLAVLKQVTQITLTKSFLTQIKDLINNSEKKGICHMLVNDGKIQWVFNDDGTI
ncbi:MAG: hypothetical protein M0P29_01950 [Sphaerochaetaceae bacterium]|nr:hypothetical protein [Sphaerochaetaceae bacterium]